MLETFSNWLSATAASEFVSGHLWITPAVQSIHILSICCVMGAALMLNMRLLGLLGTDLTIARAERRYGPWLWASALGLLLSGTVLVIGEPARELLNVLFLTKMALVLVVLALAWLLHHELRVRADAWDGSALRKIAGRTIAVSSLLLWVGIIGAGRWIAYIG